MKMINNIALVAGLILVSVSANAQTDADLQMGLTPFSAYHGGSVDNVSLSNGGLIVKIPLLSYPQRGGKLTQNYTLVYNNKPFAETELCTPAIPGHASTCSYVWESRASFETGQPGQPMGLGWVFDDDQDLGRSASSQTVAGPGTESNIYSFANFTNVDGAVHHGMPIDSTHQRSIDGSGYFVGDPYLDANGSLLTCTANCALTDSEGNAYYPNGYISNGSGIIREDTNGNQITGTYNAEGIPTEITDTVGRQIPMPVATTNFTGCAGPLPTVSASLWQPPGYNGGTLTYKFCMATITVDIPTGVTYSTAKGVDTSETVLQSIVLPNGQTWIFQYSSRNPGDSSNINYGDLTTLTFPTGGTINYTYTLETPPTAGMGYRSTSMWATSRTENAGDGASNNAWTYTWTMPSSYSAAMTNIVTDPAGNDTAHTFMDAYLPYETAVTSYTGAASGGNVIKQVQTTYGSWIGSSVNNGNSQQGYFPQTITTTLGGAVTQKNLTYGVTFPYIYAAANGSLTGNYGVVTQSTINDYGSGSPGALLRQEQTAYLFQSSTPYLTANTLNLISTHTVLGPTNNTVAQQTYTYDQSNYITSSGVTVQHGTPISAVRGNLTTTTAWLSGGTSPSSYTNWYDTGEPYQLIDPRGNATTMLYSSTYAGSLPTTITNAKSQSTSFVYDFDLGVKTSSTDPNTQTTTWNHDVMGRTISITRPEVFPGTGTHSQATICYDDVPAECTSSSPVNAVVVTEAVNPTTNLQEEEQVDGFGRKSLTRLLSDPDGVTYTQTDYDGLGRPYQVWNPTRCNPMTGGPCAGETTWGITTHLYDALSREVTTIPADGSSTSDHVTISYSGNLTTTTDEASVSHQSTTDALGRLTQVTEVNMGWPTLYQYDPLGNLLCVEQHGPVTSTGCSSSPSADATSLWRVRRFTYDTLSRLLTAKNPENGTITYQYDAANNVTSKTDPSGITINYNPSGSPIDVLNRVTEKTYSDSEPTVTYTYDSTSVSNGIGRRTGMTDASGSTIWNYDPEGKVTSEGRTINGITKSLITSYDLLDGPYQVQYPSGAVVQYTASGAGRVLSAVDMTNGINYMTGTTYAPSGAMATSTYGMVTGGFAGIALTDSYNSRLQPIFLQASTTSATVLSLGYNFGLTVNDNGNVQGISNNKNTARNQIFTYDGVNRLASAQSGTWGLQFTYDAWGNMTQTTGIPSSSLTNPMPEPADRGADGANQVTSSLVSYRYATNGDMTADGSGVGYTYNGENQINSAAGVTYTYDGDGERVAKSSGTLYWGSLAESNAAGTLTSEYIFAGGQRIARRDVATGNVYYYFSDQLGSSNVVTNATGVIQNESDFYPFGGEDIIMQNLTNQKYKFTGKERDTETTNDYFGARYYSASLGRFMSPDWAAKAEPIPYAKLENPQSLNLYAYVQGNVETAADHDGHIIAMQQLDGPNVGIAGLDMSQAEQVLDAAQMAAIDTDLASAQATPTNTNDKNASPQQGQSEAQQQGSGSTTLNFSGANTNVTYDYGTIFSNEQGGVKITATSQNCDSCYWAQVVSRTGSGAESPKKDGGGIGPLYGLESPASNYFLDTPATQKGGHGTFSAVAILGTTNIAAKSFKVRGGMSYGYKISAGGNFNFYAPRKSTSSELNGAVKVLQNHSPDWQIQ